MTYSYNTHRQSSKPLFVPETQNSVVDQLNDNTHQGELTFTTTDTNITSSATSTLPQAGGGTDRQDRQTYWEQASILILLIIS